MTKRIFVASMQGGAHEVVVQEQVREEPKSLRLEVNAWVRSADGYAHPPGVVVKIVDPLGVGFRVVQCATHGSRLPFVAADHELVVVPRARREDGG